MAGDARRNLHRWNGALSLSALIATFGCGDDSADFGHPPASTAGSSGATSGGSSGAAGGSGGGGGTSANGGATVSGGSGGGASGGVPASGGSAGSSPSTGGTSPAGGVSGTAALAGTSGLAGSASGSAGGGGAAPVDCTFTIDGSPSTAIPTVGIVDWSTDLAGLTSAKIEFTLNDPEPGVLNTGSGGPIDIGGETHRALLLGLKAERTYTYRIVASAGATVCTSPEQTLTTGAKPSNAPSVTRTAMDAAAQARGFVITSIGTSFGGGGGGGAVQMAYIFDADGDVVWWAPAPTGCSRALMNWEGTDMWMLELNVDNQGGEMRRVSMDGMDVENNVEGLSKIHHDFTVLPGGIVAGPSWTTTGRDPPSDLIERSPDGTIETVVRIDENVYQSSTYHTNAIVYYAADDTYTLGDRNPNAFVKISRTGEVLWQFGGSCTNAPAAKCVAGNWQVNHGHHLLPNNHFVFFNNGGGMSGSSIAYEYAFTETATSLSAEMVWSYDAADADSMVLGDIQRLPNGNTLVIYSNDGQMHEVTPSGDLVQVISASSFGYANFRETLYGPPLR